MQVFRPRRLAKSRKILYTFCKLMIFNPVFKKVIAIVMIPNCCPGFDESVLLPGGMGQQCSNGVVLGSTGTDKLETTLLQMPLAKLNGCKSLTTLFTHKLFLHVYFDVVLKFEEHNMKLLRLLYWFSQFSLSIKS